MTTDIRTTLNLPADLARAVDDYWYSERLKSRNEAIRALLRRALVALNALPLSETREAR